jgi:hypothetical protein
MAKAKNKRKILSVLMESPFYFTMPLRKRLELLNIFSQRSVFHRIFKFNEQLINGKSDSERKN